MFQWRKTTFKSMERKWKAFKIILNETLTSLNSNKGLFLVFEVSDKLWRSQKYKIF